MLQNYDVFNNEFLQSILRSTGFAQCGKVSANKRGKRLFVCCRRSTHTIEASNIQPGENIKFKVKDNKGIIATTILWAMILTFIYRLRTKKG